MTPNPSSTPLVGVDYSLNGVPCCDDLTEREGLSPAIEPEFPEGHVLDGRFVIREVVGRSMMATVYRAMDQESGGRAVAVKVPLTRIVSDPVAFGRFEREERIGLMLRDPLLVEFIRVDGPKSRPYLVMEYLDGCSLAYILLRHPERFPRAAVLTYAVFDIGAGVYWLAPTAPPWYAASEASAVMHEPPQVRRMMVEYGEFFWRDGWGSLYSVFGGNPLAAMPSLHFATSVMAALLLNEVGPVSGAVGFTYASTLGFALVYLGEHYVVDLIAGAALAGAVWRLGPRAAPLLQRISSGIGSLEEIAHGAA